MGNGRGERRRVGIRLAVIAAWRLGVTQPPGIAQFPWIAQFSGIARLSGITQLPGIARRSGITWLPCVAVRCGGVIIDASGFIWAMRHVLVIHLVGAMRLVFRGHVGCFLLGVSADLRHRKYFSVPLAPRTGNKAPTSNLLIVIGLTLGRQYRRQCLSEEASLP